MTDILTPLGIVKWLVTLDLIPEDQRMTTMQDLIDAAKKTQAEHDKVLSDIRSLSCTATGRMYLQKAPLEEVRGLIEEHLEGQEKRR